MSTKINQNGENSCNIEVTVTRNMGTTGR